MVILVFEDEEIQKLFDVINQLQIIFHPKYASNGKINVHDFFKIRKKEPIII